MAGVCGGSCRPRKVSMLAVTGYLLLAWCFPQHLSQAFQAVQVRCQPDHQCRTDKEKDLSPTCRPTPSKISFSESCSHPEWEMRVKASLCPRVPRDPDSVSFECASIKGVPVVNISWSLPDEGSWRAVTGYKINLFDKHWDHCSLLIPAHRHQAWFPLYNYRRVYDCLKRLNADYSDIRSIRITSLPFPWPTGRPHLNRDPDLKVVKGSIAKCFPAAGVNETRGGIRKRCRIYHPPSNTTWPITTATRMRMTTSPSAQSSTATSQAGTFTTSRHVATLSNSQTGTFTTSHHVVTSSNSQTGTFTTSHHVGTSSNSQTGTFTTSRHVVTSSDGKGQSSTPAAFTPSTAVLVVASLTFCAVCIGGVAYLLHRRERAKHRCSSPASPTEDLTDMEVVMESDRKPLPPASSERPPKQPQGFAPEEVQYLPHQPSEDLSTVHAAPECSRPLHLGSNGLSAHTHVYISYARSDPGHQQAVRTVADWLCEHGIPVVADFYYPYEMDTGPHLFVEQGIDSARHILVVWSAAYSRVWASMDGGDVDSDCGMLQSRGLMTQWEINLVRVCLNRALHSSPEVVPVMLVSDSDDQLPDIGRLLPVSLQTRRVYGLGSLYVGKDQLDLLYRLHQPPAYERDCPAAAATNAVHPRSL